MHGTNHHTYKPAYVGRVRADGRFDISGDRKKSSSLRLSARTSEQLSARTEKEVPTLEVLLHQLEVRIDPALTHNQFRPAVAIDRKNEVIVKAVENVIADALRRQ
jgi:hypothetical protein